MYNRYPSSAYNANPAMHALGVQSQPAPLGRAAGGLSGFGAPASRPAAGGGASAAAFNGPASVVVVNQFITQIGFNIAVNSPGAVQNFVQAGGNNGLSK